ncbi:hypothetical protein Shyhy02_22430 [Streptomyces hygroscopicus subsp. hygroscopicus]|nr:hypothetical protein Shyhy02_22430 [Streptomyces hygroscopicus subsp. hygroscopicus]
MAGVADVADVADSEQVPGESGRVSKILDEAGIDETAGETVPIQGEGRRAHGERPGLPRGGRHGDRRGTRHRPGDRRRVTAPVPDADDRHRQAGGRPERAVAQELTGAAAVSKELMVRVKSRVDSSSL